VRVPRSRFSPVKNTNDLLGVRSDAYVVTDDSRIVLHPDRATPPVIRLDDRYFKMIDHYEGRFPHGSPSLRRCRSLTVEGDVTTYPEGCIRTLAPGETWNGAFEVKVNEAPSDRLALEMAIGDARAYDFASIVRGGFFTYFVNDEEIELSLDGRTPASAKRVPPAIAVTRAPDLLVHDEQVTLSGVVSDDLGVSYVMVFHGEDKVFYDGTGRHGKLRSVPYTASVRLKPGLNTLIVLAADLEGHTSTRSVATYFADPALQAMVGPMDAPPPSIPVENGAE